MIWDVILDTLLDVAKLVPFLYLAYLLMEFLEHRAGGATERLLSRSGKFGPLIGGTMGLLPQCGFSAAASGLYAGRVLTTGTLLAVYLSTSDEMLPIMISHGIFPWKLLLTKFVIGVTAGFVVDLITWLIFRNKPHAAHGSFEEICEREHCHCEDHFALSALKHTLRIVAFLLIFIFAMNLGVELLGEEKLAAVLTGRPLLGPFLASLIGLLPNCAASVVLTELYLEGLLGVGPLLAGLLVNAGVGLLVLFRNNRPVWDSFRILGILWGIGFGVGLLVEQTPIGALIG